MKNQSIHILGTRIDAVTFAEATEKAIEILKGKKQHYFTTPNPEITLAADKDGQYKDVLNKSSLNIPDGMGLLYASKFLKKLGKSDIQLKERVTGTDLAIKLIQLSKHENFSIFFLGASDESNAKTIEFAKKNGAKVAGGFTENLDSAKCFKTINKAKPDLLLVALNFPRQEKWISANINKLPSVKLAIGVGGAFDFISGTKKRAPRALRALGLEWLYRLILEPRRLGRIWNATIVFPIKVLFTSLTGRS